MLFSTCSWREKSDKCDLAVQTAVALQNIRRVLQLSPHVKGAWVAFCKIGIVLFKLSVKDQIQVTYGTN